MYKLTLSLAAALTLSACMSGTNETRSRAMVSDCAGITGISAQHLYGPGARCTPQAELPYTLK